LRNIAVIAIVVLCILVSLRKPFFGALVLLAAVILRDMLWVETWGLFMYMHAYELLYVGIIMGVLLSRSGRLGEFLPQSATDWGVFGFWLVLIVTSLYNGVVIIDHKFTNLFFKAMIVYFLLSRLADTPRRVTLVAIVLVLATGYLAFEAWRKYRAGMMWQARPYYLSRIHDFGLQLAITLPVIGALMARRMKLVFRVVLLGMVPLFLLVTLRTHSRSAYLGVGAGLVLLGWYYRRRWYLLVLALPIVLYPIFHQTGEVKARLESIWTQRTASGSVDESIQSRYEQMRTAMRIFRSYPILGIGPRQFLMRYTDFVSEEDAMGGTYTMHSVPLLILTEEGLLGFGVFYGLLVLGAVRDARVVAKRVRGRPDLADIAPVAAGAAMGFLGFLVYGLAQPAMWTANIYGTLALTVACRRVVDAHLAHEQVTEEVEEADGVAFPPPAATEVAFS